MKITPNQRYLFNSTRNGNINQLDIETGFLRDWGKNDDYFQITQDGQYLFMASNDGHLRQWSISNQTIVRDWGKIFNNEFSKKFKLTSDGAYLFTIGCDRILRQFSIEDKFYKDWNCINTESINSVLISPDSKYLFINGVNDIIKQYCIKTQVFMKEWLIPNINNQRIANPGINYLGTDFSTDVYSLFIKGSFLYAINQNGFLYKYSLKRQSCVKKFGRVINEGSKLRLIIL